ncbi:MAG: DinB family protein, partial [Pyrinomonadaceae bacterium]|nr:DinB family protein [Pyrinomonadaceae bacterium]
MGFETIDDIYAENERARKRLLEVIGSMSDDDHELPTENGKWTVSMVVEHLADVEKSMSAICAKLLSAAAEKGIEHDGKVVVSPHFIEATVNLKKEGTKLEAPEVVQPKG